MTSENRSFQEAGGARLPAVARTGAIASADAGTPVYDELVASLTARADTKVAADGHSPAAQSAVMRAATIGEGTAILTLFSRLKDLEKRTGGWPDGEVVNELFGWFDELGIDLDNDVAAAARALRLPDQPLTPPHGSDVTVTIRTARPTADADMRTWVSALVTALGPGSSAMVFDAAGEQIAHYAHPDPMPSNPS